MNGRTRRGGSPQSIRGGQVGAYILWERTYQRMGPSFLGANPSGIADPERKIVEHVGREEG